MHADRATLTRGERRGPSVGGAHDLIGGTLLGWASAPGHSQLVTPAGRENLKLGNLGRQEGGWWAGVLPLRSSASSCRATVTFTFRLGMSYLLLLFVYSSGKGGRLQK